MIYTSICRPQTLQKARQASLRPYKSLIAGDVSLYNCPHQHAHTVPGFGSTLNLLDLLHDPDKTG